VLLEVGGEHAASVVYDVLETMSSARMAACQSAVDRAATSRWAVILVQVFRTLGGTCA
jgi:hypothetical protein